MIEWASSEEMKEFWDKCLQILDQQVIPLGSEDAKICAIQAVHRVLKAMLLDAGEEIVLKILRYPRRIESNRSKEPTKQKKQVFPYEFKNLRGMLYNKTEKVVNYKK